MEKLTARQRAYLKSIAHPLKPILHIGKDGVTAAVAKTVDDAFHNRELLKVRVLETAPDDARAVADALVALTADAHLVQVIGRTVVLYRRDPEKPAIVLPR